MALSTIQRSIMEVCRVATALCILGDAWWYLWSRDTRFAYFKELGLPTQLTYVVCVIYTYFGTRILLNYSMKVSTTAMVIAYGLVMFIVHHPVGEGGIGEYPRNIHRDVNLLSILKYAAIIGGVFTLSGYHDYKLRGFVMEGTQSYAIVLGRAIIGIHFIIESAYFRLYQSDLRTKQAILTGSNPNIHVYAVGAIYFFGGLNLWFGTKTRRRIAALLLATVTSLLTFLEGSSLATSVGIYHMSTKTRFHHVLTNLQITLGCIMAFIMSFEEVVAYYKKKD